ncbi:hypothetical protein [Agrobacterium genomosp. 2]|uniref:Uncharacterized protein n=1 Tax=Agrobacterium genomosp. 2 str. CFBP 5494 TaxID=1183436 RepID=A0A9W5EYX0_9HYPH|nr:hypothetical protein [Agrobacterium genomosp. 2]CUW87457.1 hypothetical protein AGR2A_Cc120054 [Agrobacterium genomosp. 2 str. CFBP 5494]
MKRLQFIESYDAPFAPVSADGDAFVVLSAVVTEQRVGRKVEPSFRVVIANPGAAGWMPAALRYADLWEQREEDPDPVLIARGRLVPLPTDMAEATIELAFRCLPPDSDDILTSAADALRIGEDFDYDPDADPADRLDAECYDPLFFSSDASDDPENVLAARPEIWRWDRASLQLGRTHLVDSDVVHDIGYQSVGAAPSLSVTNPPKPISKLRIIASWTQAAKGRQTVSEPDSVSTYTYDDFIGSFPQPGAAIGANTGWTLAEAEIEDVQNDLSSWMTISGVKFGNASGGQVELRSKTVHFRLTAAYDYSQQRQEILDIVMPSGLQDLPDEDDQSELIESPIQLGPLNIDSSTREWIYEDPETLEVIQYVVGDEVLAAGKAWTCAIDHEATEDFRVREYDGGPVLWLQREKRAPMRDSRNSRFLDLPRGIRAVRHAVLRLDRAVMERRQCAETTFEVPWMLGRGITTAHSCRIAHPKLPGVEVTGKVTAVELNIERGGRRSAKITIVSIPGSGSIAPIPGPDQHQTGDIVYSTSYRQPRVPVNAFALASVPPRHYFFENTAADQRLAAMGSDDPVGTIGSMPTRLKIAMPALREEDLLTRRMSVTCLPPALPRQINLRPDLGGE